MQISQRGVTELNQDLVTFDVGRDCGKGVWTYAGAHFIPVYCEIVL